MAEEYGVGKGRIQRAVHLAGKVKTRRLTSEQLGEIVKRRAAGQGYRTIATEMGLNYHTVYYAYWRAAGQAG